MAFLSPIVIKKSVSTEANGNTFKISIITEVGNVAHPRIGVDEVRDRAYCVH